MPIIVDRTDTFEQWRVKTNNIGANLETSVAANVATLNTSISSNVATLNSAILSNVSSLTSNITNINSNIGNLSNLVTITKSNIVAAINETQSLSNITGGNVSVNRLVATTSNITSANTLNAFLSTATVFGNLIVDTNTLYVDSIGNEVGIGTANPSSNLHVIGTANITSNVVILGNLGVRTSSPTYPLHVIGAIYATGDITSASDISLKEDVFTITNALDIVSSLRGVRYKMKDSQEAKIGLIANEVQQVIPEVVDTKSEYLGISYGNLVGVLVEAIKELKAEIDTLKNK